MIKRLLAAAMSALVVLTFVAACSILQEPEQASGTIEAIPLAVTPGEAEDASLSEAAVIEEAGPVEQVEGSTSEAPAGSGKVMFQINPEESQVRFELDEDLRGQRKTVVGATDQLAGEIAANVNDLSTAQVGIIQVNARTLVTDNRLRNRAIANWILETGDFEWITFTPTAINGLPESVSVGETVDFTIVGDLAIRDVTNEVSFAVQATLASETQLVGTAGTVVSRSDFDLSIPSVPNVANVEEEVELTIDFVADTV